MAAMFHGSYVVYDSHELFPEQSFVRKSREMLSAMEAHLSPLADSVIVVNQSMTDEMKLRYGIDSEVILNCPSFDPRLLPVRRTNRLRESLGIPESMQILLYQGNIVSKIRNLENVIRAMTLIRRSDVALVLMGPDNGGGKDLVSLAAESQLLGRTVFFHPAVKQSELLGYTASADAGLIPYTPVDWNTKFCTPNKLYEFIVAGLPILANDLPELIRFVETLGIGANLPMGSAEEVARAIDSFFSADRERFRRTLADVSERFVWQNGEGRRIVEMYGRLMNTPPRLGTGRAAPAREPFCVPE
jgi:glycosyltransferase involved in cell wall biosynthesis